jgi:hypothetical protein
MDVSEYFRIVSAEDNVIHFEHRGNWTDQVIEQMGDEFFRQWKEAVDSMGGERFIVLGDISNFTAVGPKLQEYLTRGMSYALEHNMYKAVEVISRAQAQIGVKDAAMKTERPGFRVFATSLAKAQEIVEKLKEEL